jgi:hypothetical protein
MALQKVNRNLLNTGVSDSSDATAITIDSSENVGIGNTSPLGKLTISNAAGANAPTSITAANTYLQLGSDDYGASSNGKFMIGFGYTDATNTNSPAYIGFEETSSSGDTKGVLTFHTRDVITDTAPTERMRIDTSGRVMIGTTTEGRAGEGADMLTIGDDGSNNSGLTMRSGTSGYGSIYFSDATSGAAEYAGYLQYSHANERLHIATGSSIMLNVDSDGLKFNNDTATSNALDDYEEGTWTPALVNGGSASTDGWYTKIGNVVIATYYIGFSSLGTGSLKISGLPFSAGYSSNGTVGSAMARFYTGDNLASYLPPGTILEFYNTQSSTWDIVLNSDFNNNAAQIHGTHIYKTAT